MLALRITIAALAVLESAAANTYPIILKGKVTMEDGSPPPFTVGIERICSDEAGSAPGPITNKKGEYQWRMEIDPLATRDCYIRATHTGYTSTTIEVQGLDTTKTLAEMPPMVMSSLVSDPYTIHASESNLPGRAKSAFDAAMKALDAGNFAEAARQIDAAVTAYPKFAQGWHALGVVDERLDKSSEARDAYQHAIQADPKLLQPYVTLTRLAIKTKDWETASKTADALIKADPKRLFPEIYLHRAVARYELKDFDGAVGAAQEAIRLDPNHKRPRAEYVLGRSLEAKGDAAGAREHIAKYVELDPMAADIELVKGHLQFIGKPEAAGVEPALENL